MPLPVNLTIRLNATRRRMANSMYRLIRIAINSDAKLYASNPPRAFLPIFPTDDAALQAALTLISDRLLEVTNTEV